MKYAVARDSPVTFACPTPANGKSHAKRDDSMGIGAGALGDTADLVRRRRPGFDQPLHLAGRERLSGGRHMPFPVLVAITQIFVDDSEGQADQAWPRWCSASALESDMHILVGLVLALVLALATIFGGLSALFAGIDGQIARYGASPHRRKASRGESF